MLKQLTMLGYEPVEISNEAGLLANLKRQLERHNKMELSGNEFSRVLNHLNKGNVFDRAKILRDRMQFTKDNGESIYLEFLQLDHWCRNLFQVTRQVTVEGTYKNRYDVTILVNGFPLVQIELKRRGLELKEAFNQVNRYQRHSFWSSNGLFRYVQLFIIPNGVNTIRDDNVLKFLVEYVGRYKGKEGSPTHVDFDAENLESPALMEAEKRLEKIAGYIIEDLPRKTHQRSYNAMFCVNSVDMLKKYYDIFKKQEKEGKHNLKIGTIFSYVANEEDKDATGDMSDESFSLTGELPLAADGKQGYVINMHSRDKLEEYIGDYNTMFNTKFTTRDSQSFYNFFNDISRRTRNRELDLLLVVNMFLTGFDSPRTNTLYVDKNLRHHGIIQAYSRTNRILNEQKSQGNIVCFRNLKERTDEAVALFSNKEANEVIFREPYEEYREQLNQAIIELYRITPTVNAVNDLPSETEKLKFILAFRSIMRMLNVAKSFADFLWDHYCMSEQTFNDFKSKYLDLYQNSPNGHNSPKDDGVTTLDDIDFELELIHRDEINVAYILTLLAKLKESDVNERAKRRQEIVNLLAGETNLRPKRELIHKFMEEELPSIADVEDIPVRFETFWTTEQNRAFEQIVKEENLNPGKLDDVIQEYLFTNRKPRRDQIIDLLNEPPRILERKTIVERIMDRLMRYIETFINNLG